jgi:hypothetical protein
VAGVDTALEVVEEIIPCLEDVSVIYFEIIRF